MSIAKEFKTFVARGNVLDLAVGVIVGGAFGRIITSLVEDILMPPIGYMLGGVNFTDLYFTLDGAVYDSVADAKASSSPVIAYGQFINTIINFLIIAFCIFLVVKGVNTLRKSRTPGQDSKGETAAKPPEEKECPYCLSKIPVKATRCPQCTSHIVIAGTTTVSKENEA